MISNRSFYLLLGLCLLTAVMGMVMVPLMDIDASQYASISREMLANHSYLQVFDLKQDYLDKPPMLFWLSAFSMKIFGVHDWSYRLPSFLFAILAVYATFKLASIFYERTVAQLAALVLASSQAMFLITHDVRCDTMLMGWVALSLWQLAAWYQTKSWKHFLLGFVAVAGGMMTKGPIALLVPAFAFAPHFILRRQWMQLLRWEYLPGLLIIGILLVPMSIGLYQQFDMHPGKLINGVPIKSGLRFYYWTQSFGRYTGENRFNEMNNFSFLLENMFWSFLPWILIFLLALVTEIISIIKKKFKLASTEEWISVGGFILTYCALARSQAQLPHYIFVVFPLAAIVTGKFLFKLLYTVEWEKWRKPLLVIHACIFTLLWIAVVVLMEWPFESIPKVVGGFAALCMVVFLLAPFSIRLRIPKLITIAVFTAFGVNFFMSTFFYPSVLEYQLGNDAAAFMDEQHINKDQLAIYGIHEGRALHFYAQHIFPEKASAQDFQSGSMVLTSKDSIPVFQRSFPALRVLHEGPAFGVTALSLPFLNPATRDKEVPKYVIIDLDGKPAITSH